MRPQAPHPGQVVLELGELDLELAGGAVRVVGEDVEDDRGAIDHGNAERRLEVALLSRCELVVAGDEVGAAARDRGPQLLELAAAEVAVGIGLGPLLDHARLGGDAGGAQELAELDEIGVLAGETAHDADRDGALARPRVADRARRGFRLDLGHVREV